MNELIGNTPLIKINYRLNGIEKSIYAKLESFNLSGSIKDRVAFYILEKARKRNELRDGMPIVEVTSGNTGIAFAALGAYYRYPVTIFMPDWVSQERIKLLKLYGAQVILISKEEGGFEECIKRADALALKTNGYRPNQFDNYDNVNAHYEGTAVEILKQIPSAIDAFISGVGTGGTLMGVGKRLKEVNPQVQVIAIEPLGAAILKKGYVEKKDHKIEGIGDGLIPKIVDCKIIDDIYLIDDEDAVNMSRLLAQKLGLAVGISSGANLLGAIQFQKLNGGRVVTVFPDDNKKYLSTDLTKPLDFNPNFVSNQIELLSYEIIASKEKNVL
ncbi:MAG: cysteine synthase family protein [Bacilli bacterium]|nr:cysteine synthase family protein [Bacilli bacterium]